VQMKLMQNAESNDSRAAQLYSMAGGWACHLSQHYVSIL
jgi:hypothetical protein